MKILIIIILIAFIAIYFTTSIRKNLKTEMNSVKTFEALQKVQISISSLDAMKGNKQADSAKAVIKERLEKLSHEVFGLQKTS